MHPDPRKIAVVASSEFGSAIRTKSFLIMLLLLQVIMGGSILLQLVVAKRVDTRPRRIGVVDPTNELYGAIEKAAEIYNSQCVDAAGKAIRPRIELSNRNQGGNVDPPLVLALSDRIRHGELDAFLVIPPGIVELSPGVATKAPTLEYHSDNPNDDVARNWLIQATSRVG